MTTIPGKDARLITHGFAAGAIEMEATSAMLLEDRLTPASKLFVRNNDTLEGGYTLQPVPLADWELRLEGLLKEPVTLQAKELLTLPQVEVEMVLQCSGNGREYFNWAAMTSGSAWQCGAMGNVSFKGVKFAEVLKARKIETLSSAKYVTVRGRDNPVDPKKEHFEHSILLSEMLERSILAFTMNGEPIPAVHGGPIRLVTPGYYGTMQMKWAWKFYFTDQESTNNNHLHRYRTPLTAVAPGSTWKSTLENSEPNWRMKIKSVILSPEAGARVAGNLLVRGVTWNDGSVPIKVVQLSTDDGQSWMDTKLTKPGSPYAWYQWEQLLNVEAGKDVTLVCRAVDEAGHTQPADGQVAWNPQGYTWNGLHRVTVKSG